MKLTELPGLITKHVGMLKAAAGEILDNPGFKHMQARQNIWTGQEYATPDHPIGHDVRNMAAGTAYDNADQYDTGSANLKARMGMNERPLREQMMGIARTTYKADIQSREDYTKEAQAQQAQPHTSRASQVNLGGDLDTNRHVQLSAMMAQEHPRLGKLALLAHEGYNIPQLQDNPRESLRDTRNNEMGWMIGEHAPASDLRVIAGKLTNVMSNKTAAEYLPINIMKHRQSVWWK